MWNMTEVKVQTDKAKAIKGRFLNPHYTYELFKRAQTIYLSEDHKLIQRRGGSETVQEAGYEYSDRLRSRYTTKEWYGAMNEAECSFATKNSAEYFEVFLRELLEEPELELVHIMAGFNLASGHPYQVFGFITDS